MAGVFASHSYWIHKEVNIAKEEFSQPKPVIAIKPLAHTNISTFISAYADEIVGWNSSSIVDAIRRLSI